MRCQSAWANLHAHESDRVRVRARACAWYARTIPKVAVTLIVW